MFFQPKITCQKWADEYLAYSRQKFAQRTVEGKERAFRELLGFFGQKFDVRKITCKLAFDHLAAQAERRTGAAANADRKDLRAGWAFGVKFLDFPEKNPFSISKFPQIKRKRYVPPKKDMLAVLNVAEPQDHAILTTMLHTAGRKNEILGLKWTDVDFENRKITLWTKKRAGSHTEPDDLPMTDVLRDCLMRYAKTCPASEYVFSRKNGTRYLHKNHLMRELCAAAGVKKFTYHCIRHLSASMLAEAGVPLVVIQRILRHKSISTTSRYIHSLRCGREEIERAFDLCE